MISTCIVKYMIAYQIILKNLNEEIKLNEI